MDPKKFIGLDSVADAVEYLHSGSSLGKVSFQAQFEKKKKKFCLVISLVIKFFSFVIFIEISQRWHPNIKIAGGGMYRSDIQPESF